MFPKNWEILPDSFKKLKSVEVFKRSLKTSLLDFAVFLRTILNYIHRKHEEIVSGKLYFSLSVWIHTWLNEWFVLMRFVFVALVWHKCLCIYRLFTYWKFFTDRNGTESKVCEHAHLDRYVMWLKKTFIRIAVEIISTFFRFFLLSIRKNVTSQSDLLIWW